VTSMGMTSARRSVWAPKPVAAGSGADVPDALPPYIQVLLGDSMGELGAYYAAADLAFIGGSLLPLGGQNLIEACAAGVPVLIGPHTFNFTQATKDAINAGAALRVEDPQGLARGLRELLNDKPRRLGMSAAAAAFAAAHRGATDRTVTVLSALLEGNDEG
jgi:3-deoxy-D-manno-octulosonic-acid transferase